MLVEDPSGNAASLVLCRLNTRVSLHTDPAFGKLLIPIGKSGSPALLMIHGWNFAQHTPFSRGFSVVVAWRGTFIIKSAGEPEISASFEQENGATRGGQAMSGEVGAYSGATRHAVKCAEQGRTHDLA
jgi:hypothetical protein